MEKTNLEKNPSKKNHKKYAKISTQVRRKLINRVINQGKTIFSSAKYYRVKFSTAKAIVRKFKETGEIFSKKTGILADSDSNQQAQQIIFRKSVAPRASLIQKQALIKLQEIQKQQKEANGRFNPQPTEQHFHVDTSTILNAMHLHFLLTMDFQLNLSNYCFNL